MCQAYTEKLIAVIEKASILVENREKHFKRFLAVNKITSVYVCPSCGFPTLRHSGSYDICSFCLWEDGCELLGVNCITLDQSRYEFQMKLDRFLVGDRTWEICDYSMPSNDYGWDTMPFDIEKGMTQLLKFHRIPKEKYSKDFNVAFVKNEKLTLQELLLVAEAKQCFWYPEAFTIHKEIACV